MICLTPKSKPKKKKKYEIIRVSLWLPSSLNLLDYTIWRILGNKTNAISYPNMGSLKSGIEEEKNKMYEELILKACK